MNNTKLNLASGQFKQSSTDSLNISGITSVYGQIINIGETVSRNIYVKTTGNDTTGTGSLAAPYLTVGKALGTVKSNILSGVVVMVSASTGSFAVTANDLNVMKTTTGAGTLTVKSLGNTVYPEIERNLSATLANNATTNVIVGNKLQNKSITIKYLLTRSTGYRFGTFDIICDGTSVYMSPDAFTDNLSAYVSETAIVFSTNVSSNEIRLAAVVNSNTYAATLTYSVERVMITSFNI